MSHLACFYNLFDLSSQKTSGLIGAESGNADFHPGIKKKKDIHFFSQAVKMISAARRRVQNLAGADVHDRPIFVDLFAPFVPFWFSVGETLLLIRQPPPPPSPSHLPFQRGKWSAARSGEEECPIV